MLNSHFLREKRMRFKARFPEVFFCRRDYLECLFLLACLFPPPSGCCHRWPAWPGSEVRPEPRSGEMEGSRLPGNPGEGVGVGAGGEGGLPGASQVERSAREVLSHGHCNHFLSAQPLTWEKPQHSEMESWIAHFKASSPDPAHFTASLSIACSFSNFDSYLSLLQIMWKNILWIDYLSVFFFGFNLTEQCSGFKKQVKEFFPPFFIFFLIKHVSNAFPFGNCQDLSELSGFFFFSGFMEKMSLLSLCLCW